MYNYTTTTYLGYTIHIVTAKSDASENIQLSVMANPFSSTAKTLAINFHDIALENAGWTRKSVINGGLFFTESNIHYANGIERAYGVTNENDDSSLNTVMAFAHSGLTSNEVVLDTQANIAASIDNYRGAITGAFGLLRNGSIDQGSTSLQGNYTSKSGRSIIGSKQDGTIYFISVAGVTGSSGLTGEECLSLVQTFNLYNAIAMDGGGSVSLISEDEWKVSTTRLIKNAVAIYSKTIIPTPDPITPPASTAELPAPKKGTTAVNRMYFGANKVNKIIRIDPANQNPLTIYRDTVTSTNFPQQFGTTYTWNSETLTATANNHPYIDRITTTGGYYNNPSLAFNNGGDYTSNAGFNYAGLPGTWIIYTKNCRVSIQGFTISGWGQNDYPYNSPMSFYIQGSNDGTNWTTIYDHTAFPSSWQGDSMYWGISESYPYATQRADGSDPYLGWGPNGSISVPANVAQQPYYPSGRSAGTINYTNYYFTIFKIIWRANQDNNGSNTDPRKYWTPGYTGYSWLKANRLALRQISFNAKIQPL